MASSDSTVPSLLDEYRRSQGGSPLLAEYRKSQEPSPLQKYVPTLDDLKRVLSAEYEAGRGAVNTLFQGIVGAPVQALQTVLAPQTPEEQANPIAQGYASAKVGDLSHLNTALDFNMARINAASARQAETSTIPPDQQQAFKKWLAANKVTDLDNPGSHYDYRGAFLAGVNRGDDGHWPDTYKQHGHPTFSVESQYSAGPNDGGHWEGNTFVPAAPGPAKQAVALAKGLIPNPVGHIQQAIQAPTWFEKGEAVGSVPLDLGVIYGLTHGLASAADALTPNRTGPADIVPDSKVAASPKASVPTRSYGGQNTVQPLSLLDQYRQAVAQSPVRDASGFWDNGTAEFKRAALGPTADIGRPFSALSPSEQAAVAQHVGLPAAPAAEVVPTSPTPTASGEPGTPTAAPGSREIAPPLPKDLTKASTVDLITGYHDRLDRLQNMDVGFWAREDPNAVGAMGDVSGLVRTGTTGSAQVNQARAFLDKLEGELTRRGFDADQLDRLYRDHVDQQAAASGAARAAASDFNPEIGWSLPINVSRAAGEGPRAIPAETEATAKSPLKLTAPRAGIAGAIQTMFAPATRSPEAATAAGIVRFRAAEFARAAEVAHEALGQYRRVVSKLTPAEQLGLIDDLEHGRSPTQPALLPVAKGIRGALDAARDDVRALGTGALENFNRDYVPHIWQDPEKAEGILSDLMSRRPLEGSKSFLKHRTIPTIAEGIEAGLVPVTTNPLDLALLKLREMRRYVMGQRIMADLKDNGLTHYVPVFSEGPKGYQPINDRIAKVYGPPTVPISESYDPFLRQQLEAVLEAVGGEHTRTIRMPGGKALGSATGTDVRTRFGSSVEVLEHEIGHALDTKYGLWDYLTDIPGKEKAAVNLRAEMQGELRALADLRFEGQDPGPGYRRYVRQGPEKVANAIHALLYVPERMGEIAPTVKAKLTAFLESKPELQPLLHLQKSLVAATSTADVPVGGLVVKGQHWAPEPVARVLNNYLQPGLRGNALFDSYMSVGNLLNQAQLGLSAFHLGFTSVDAAVSRAALGIEQMVAGRPFAATKTLAGVPTAPFTTYLKGSKVLREYLNPGTPRSELGAIVDALVQAGGRVRMDRIYKNNSVEAFQNALKNRQPGRAALQSLPALLELASKPVLEHVVPRQKLGVFADLARFELSRLPKDASPGEVRAALGKVWDSVDNRMGQLVYDSLFWSRTLKDLSLASVRSVGWNLGTIRELGGGAADIVRGRFTHRAAYAIALPFTVGLMGAVTQYLYTGQGPQELRDYFFPRTGKINPDGNEERVQLPSYMKDVVSVARHPFLTAQHKIQPFLSSLAEMLENKDFYGDQIRNPHDPYMVQLQQEAKYVANQFVPFGVRNALQQRREGQSRSTQLQSFVGITPAPREIVRTPAQNLMSEYMAERGQGSATPEERADRERRGAISRRVREGSISPAQLGDSMRAGVMSREQAAGILRRQEEAPWINRFRNLTWEEGESVFAKATPGEQAVLRPLMIRKRVEEFMRLKKAGVNDGRVAQLARSLRATAGK